MSHAIGAVRFHRDGAVLWYEYDGTVDMALPDLYSTRQELKTHWRQEPRWINCPHAGEPVEIFSDYGRGFWWEGSACRVCSVICPPLQPDDASVPGAPLWLVQTL